MKYNNLFCYILDYTLQCQVKFSKIEFYDHLIVFIMTADEQLLTDCTQQLPKIAQRRPLD